MSGIGRHIGRVIGHPTGRQLTLEGKHSGLPFLEDLLANYSVRSANTIIDSIGGDPLTIKTPVLFKNSNTSYASVADNQSLDIGTNDFTFYMWVNRASVTTSTAYLGGKGITSSVNGRYCFYVDSSGIVYAFAQSSGGTITISSDINFFGADGPYLLVMTIDQTNKLMHFYINNVEIGTGTAFTGTFANLSTSYKFYIGGGQNTSYAAASIQRGTFGDVGVLHRVITSTERAALYAHGEVTGRAFHTDCVLRQDNEILDLSGNELHMTGSGLLKADCKKYRSWGSLSGLNNGYSRYIDYPFVELYYTNSDAGVALTGFTPPTGFSKEDTYSGNASLHNGADSYLTMVSDLWDRSDTDVCSYLARRTDVRNRYDSGNVKDFHITEVSNLQIGNYFANGYYGRAFSKFTGNVLNGILEYTTNKTGSDYNRVLAYLRESILDFEYEFIEYQVLHARGKNILAVKDSKIYLSTDSGETWSAGLTVGSETFFSHGRIFHDGTLMFCSNTTAYYSDDALSTYNVCTVLDENGDPFVSGTLNQFRDLVYSSPSDESVYGHVWGSYITNGTAKTTGIHIFQSFDGKTIKGVYHFGAPNALARHCHSVNYNPADNSIWVCTGDGTDESNLIKGTYDPDLDEWTWDVIGTGNNTTIWQNVGLVFNGDEAWVNNEARGVYRSDYDQLDDSVPDHWEICIKPDTGNSKKFVAFNGLYEKEMILTLDFGNDIFVTQDGINWRRKTVEKSGGVSLATSFGSGYWSIKGRLSNGYYFLTVPEDGDGYDDYDAGYSIKIRIKPYVQPSDVWDESDAWPDVDPYP